MSWYKSLDEKYKTNPNWVHLEKFLNEYESHLLKKGDLNYKHYQNIEDELASITSHAAGLAYAKVVELDELRDSSSGPSIVVSPTKIKQNVSAEDLQTLMKLIGNVVRKYFCLLPERLQKCYARNLGYAAGMSAFALDILHL